MKSFTNRNPYLIGLVTLGVVLVLSVGAVTLTSNFFARSYTVSASFPNTAGLASGDQVMVAGIKAGSVGAIRLNGNQVTMKLRIHSGVQLPADTSANIQVESLLGTEAVYLDAGHDWAHPLHNGSVIRHTSDPFQLVPLVNETVPVLNQTNSAALNQLLADLQSITKGQRGNVAAIVDNLTTLTGTINAREQEVSTLLDAATSLSNTINARSGQLNGMVANLNTVVEGLAQRRTALAQVVDATDQAAQQMSAVIGPNRTKLNQILAQVHSTLQVIGAHQVDLTQGLNYFASGMEGYSNDHYVGPNFTPAPYISIFFAGQNLGPTDVVGPCGIFNSLLNEALPPDPAQSGGCLNQPSLNPRSASTNPSETGSAGSSGPSLPGAAPSASGPATAPPSPPAQSPTNPAASFFGSLVGGQR